MADRSVKVTISADPTGFVNGMRTAKKATEDFAGKSATAFDRNRQNLDELAGAPAKAGLALTAAP